MKNLILMLILSSFLAGCTYLNAFLGKIPLDAAELEPINSLTGERVPYNQTPSTTATTIIYNNQLMCMQTTPHFHPNIPNSSNSSSEHSHSHPHVPNGASPGHPRPYIPNGASWGTHSSSPHGESHHHHHHKKNEQ